MASDSFEARANLLASYIASSSVVNFGSAEDAVSEEWIKKAEERLGLRFSRSYRWFLENYRGGEICGEEIYSVYGEPFDDVNGGDIVYHHIIDVRNGHARKHALAVSATDLGEYFFFDYSRLNGDEVPIRVTVGSSTSDYAEDFHEFLRKRISAYAGPG